MVETVVVTGAAGGIGWAVSEAFADRGERVVLSGRNGDTLDELAASLPDAVAVRADVRDEYDVERLMETAARAGDGGVDVVVPAAAVSHGDAGETGLAGESYAAFDDTLRTNARGVFATVREALPHMSADGRVLVPTGGAGHESQAGDGAYGVSKAAAEGVMRAFAAEADPAVGCLDPGPVATGLLDGEGRDPESIAGLFTWAADLPADELNGETLGLEAWRDSEQSEESRRDER